jgi:indolepyruvate ferredoxin oxidoreductase alpha subunit
LKRLMLGNEAVARGVHDAGATVVSSYPGTPSTEITEVLSKYDDIYSEWAPNEKVAMEVAIGASVAGARSFCAMKHVGLNVAADPLFTASYTGVNGGMVIAVADDPGMHSSQNEQDSRYYARSAHVLMLEPSDSSECYEFARLAYTLSEKYDTPVIIRLTTRIAHSQSIVEEREAESYTLKEYKKNFTKYVMMPAMAKMRHVVVEKRDETLKALAETIAINSIEMNDTKVGFVCSGVVYDYAKEAFPNASFLKLGMVYPLPSRKIKEFAAMVDTLIVAEELEPYFEEHIKALGIQMLGKDHLTLQGELSPTMLRTRFADIMPAADCAGAAIVKTEASVPNRPPVLCPGCPHRGTFYILGKLGLAVSGDIGCYTLGALPPISSIDTCVCMGASVSMLHGMQKARGEEFAKKAVAVIGDSTFIHSGITGLIDIVYNKGVSTVIILDNSITGMTGHQQNPTTGYTIKGEPTKQVDLKKLCEAIGVDRVQVCDPFDLKAFEQLVKQETAIAEPSVIIAQRPCVLLKSVKPQKQFKVNTDKCKKCLNCLKIGCPCIVKKDGGVEINYDLCKGCGLCTKLCAFGAIERVQ